jgi:NAD(P)-dependent dehydrogenase (short-subunit alcohol dehydrogenase family)
MELGIEGLRVVVTAGAAGIGRAIAEGFLAEGARVHVCDVDEAALQEFLSAARGPESKGAASGAAALSGSVCDVADRQAVTGLFDEAIARLGGLDCLVNNAGIAGPTGAVHEIDPPEWDRCIDVNLTGQFNCARLAIPHLLAAARAAGADAGRQSMLNLSSLAGRFGFAMRAPYAASKWAVIGFSKSLALELGPAGIRVNALLPGIVAGDRQRRVLEAKAKARGIAFEAMEQLAFSSTSIKSYVTPRQLADYAVFTASPLARTVSGQALSVCGDTNMLS